MRGAVGRAAVRVDDHGVVVVIESWEQRIDRLERKVDVIELRVEHIEARIDKICSNLKWGVGLAGGGLVGFFTVLPAWQAMVWG